MSKQEKPDKKDVIGAEEAVLMPDSTKGGDSIRISSEVVAVIVGIVSSDIPGIAGMSGGLVGGIAEKLGKRDLTRGVKVQVNEDRVTIDLNVIVEYGMSIVDSTDKLKKEIRCSVEKTTGLKVEAININVLGINIPEEEEKEEVKKEKKEKKAADLKE
ncbi:MAG: Asp23/Gls24 family envelope stress response protein [Bacillota bacterium]|nr:Asp23/Gls24 family envelope stress response protein [Bacillota bacterium]